MAEFKANLFELFNGLARVNRNKVGQLLSRLHVNEQGAVVWRFPGPPNRTLGRVSGVFRFTGFSGGERVNGLGANVPAYEAFSVRKIIV